MWKFKGSIFLTFKTEDAAKAFVGKEEKYKEGALLKPLAFEGCSRGLAYAIFNPPSCSHRAISLVEVARLQ